MMTDEEIDAALERMREGYPIVSRLAGEMIQQRRRTDLAAKALKLAYREDRDRDLALELAEAQQTIATLTQASVQSKEERE